MQRNLVDRSGFHNGGTGAFAIAGAVALATLFGAPATAPAADCSIETHGEAAYERVTERIQEKLYKVEQFTFEPYRKVEISLEPGCIFKLHGAFSIKVQQRNVAKVYDARLTPKSGAPHGMKIVKMQISGR